METVPLTTLSSCLKIDPLRLLQTSTGHRPTIFINRRNNTITFHHQPSLFPSGHLEVMCGHRSRHVVKAVGMHGGDEEYVSKNKARGVAGATVVFACVVGAMCFTRPMCRPALAIWLFWSSKPPTEGEKLPEDQERPVSTLEFFLKEADGKKNEKDASDAQKRLDDMLKKITDFDPKKPSPVEPVELKKTARKFAWNTDRGKAKTVLDKLAAKYKDLSGSGKNQETAETLGRILVEMKIFLGMQTEAEEELKKLMAAAKLTEIDLKKDDLELFYVDFRLYKAVISLMSNKKDDAWFWWNKYKSCPSEEPGQDTGALFQKFEAKLKN
ncbi:hypothetical protein MRB53_036028 [Persea americana]|uniref:Uncharacterized protein n=1 Tax=Persea americana TaxID=3435 RepID=A0ACC2K6P0_PERAE|nr:hypothetical protein MRB53_036028 [Persea americana]